MAKVTKSFVIDGKKLRKAIVARGLNMEQISRETGRSASYMSNVMFEERISEAQALLLDRMYGIPRSEYEHVEPTPVVEDAVKETPVVGIDMVALYNTIYSAVYNALRKNAEDMRDSLFTSREAM